MLSQLHTTYIEYFLFENKEEKKNSIGPPLIITENGTDMTHPHHVYYNNISKENMCLTLINYVYNYIY